MPDEIERDDEFPPEEEKHWPLTWGNLLPRERWLWWEQLWSDVLEMRERYGLPLRQGWWESDLQVEALAAFCAAIARYDTGEWDSDPLGKLALLYESQERLVPILTAGARHGDRFHPDRDRLAFARHLIEERGCQPPPNYETESARRT